MNAKWNCKEEYKSRKFVTVVFRALFFSVMVILLHCIGSFVHQFCASSSTALIPSVALSNAYLESSLSKAANRFLDRRYFTDKVSNVESINNGFLTETSKMRDTHLTAKNHGFHSTKTQLVRFKMEDVVKCLDSMLATRKRVFRVTFVGDSLMRNQFTSFLRLVPDYDRTTSLKHKDLNTHYQVDNNVTSRIFEEQILVSFHWNALVNEDLIADFKLWSALTDREAPDLIFLGSTVHNMLKEDYGLSDRPFWEIVEEDLLPILLKYLTAHPQKQIVWVLQNPTNDLLSPIRGGYLNRIIHLKKIHHYNKKIRQIFKDSPVAIWDSLHPVIEENVRSCPLQRYERWEATAYNACSDFIHYGHRILSLGTQLIFNHICNHQKKSSTV